MTKPFNWNRVIRHELVHVFNLEQTKGKVPHWFTEGLAVRYEGPNIPPSWHALLADKVNNNELLNLDNILLGFIRPRSPLQWQQAYLQSLLYVEYLDEDARREIDRQNAGRIRGGARHGSRRSKKRAASRRTPLKRAIATFWRNG